jgi:hypothetical protein
MEVKVEVLWRIVLLRILSFVERTEGKKAKRCMYKMYYVTGRK